MDGGGAANVGGGGKLGAPPAAARGSLAAARGSAGRARGSDSCTGWGGAARALGSEGIGGAIPGAGRGTPIPDVATGVLIMSSSLIQYKIASGNCGCCVNIFRASSGFESEISFNFAITSYISPLFILFRADATALLPATAAELCVPSPPCA